MRHQRLTVLDAQIRCHEILAAVAARDGDAEWVTKHKAAIDRLTLERCRRARHQASDSNKRGS